MSQIQRLKTFLNKYRSRDGVYNLVGLGDFAGKYFIDADFETSFWACYNQCLETGEAICLAEKSMYDSIPRLDLDIVDPSEDHRSDECLKKIIQVANECLKSLLEVRPDQLLCIVLGKPYRKEKLGLHIHWPMFTVDQKTMAQWIIAVRDELGSSVFAGRKLNPVDCASCNVPWLLYGSRKNKPGAVAYQIQSARDHMADVIDLEQVFEKLKLMDPTTGERITGPYSRLMTIHPCGRGSLRPRVDNLSVLEEWKQPETSRPIKEECGPELLRSLVELISHERCDVESRFSWKLGALVYRVSAGSQEGYAIWDGWMEKIVECYSSESTKLGWARFGKYCKENPALGLLKFFAKTDDPEAYRVTMDTYYATSFTIGGGGGGKMSSREAAELCYKMMGKDEFKFSANQWYRFKDNVWATWDVDSLKRHLSHDVRDRVTAVMKKTSTAPENPKLISFASKFEEPFSLQHIVDMLKYEAIDAEFVNRLDKRRDLIAFRNGVFELETDVFRAGRPEDYLSITMNCSYPEKMAWGDPAVKEIEDIMETFFPIYDLREYMIDILAHVFVGNKRFKSLFLWVGGGDNGKSVFAKWISKMLGSGLAVSCPTTVLTSSRSRPGVATPELAILKDKRLALFHEPGKNEQLTDGVLKTLTGRDEIMARGLYKDPEQIVSSAIYVIVANHEPKLSNPDDQATWNRFRVCEFPSTFVDPNSGRKIPPTRQEQVEAKVFPMIHDFEDVLDRLTPMLAWYLLERWKRVRKHPINTPERVKQATRRYRENNNILANFLKERVVVSQGSHLDFYEFVQAYNNHRKQKFKPPIMESRLIEEINIMPPFQVTGDKIMNMAWNPEFRWDQEQPESL